jgi:hypothetical protein
LGDENRGDTENTESPPTLRFLCASLLKNAPQEEVNGTRYTGIFDP